MSRSGTSPRSSSKRRSSSNPSKKGVRRIFSASPTRKTVALLPLLILAAAGCPRSALDRPGPTIVEPRQVEGVLTGDDRWEGTIDIVDDILVTEGATLTILPGARIRIKTADTGKTEPEYLNSKTEILVRGRLVARGKRGAPIVFEAAGPPETEGEASWAGIIFDGGEGEVTHSRISGSQYGLLLLSSSPALREVKIEDVFHGIMMYGTSRPRLESVSVTADTGGLYLWGSSAPELTGVTASAGEREGMIVAPGADPSVRDSRFTGPMGGVLWGRPDPPPAGISTRSRVVTGRVSAGPAAGEPVVDTGAGYAAGTTSPSQTYKGETYIGWDVTWEGEVLIDGSVYFAPEKVLTIKPGTVVRFAWLDTDDDGMGESAIFMQGKMNARGEKERPIVFTAADGQGYARWGAVNIMGSDEDNIISHAIFESAYRGFHSHFSNFRLENSLFRNNLRAIQFQDSRAVITGTTVIGNRSGVRFRDSDVVIEGIRVEMNTSGLQALRAQLSLTGSEIRNNIMEGINLRETEGIVAGNTLTGNSPGLRAADSRLRLERNVIAGNSLGGVQVRRSEAVLTANRISGNVGNGLFTDNPSLVLRENVIAGNLRFALENNAPTAVDAAGNFWGVEAGRLDALLYDRRDDPRLGAVDYEPVLTSPPGRP